MAMRLILGWINGFIGINIPSDLFPRKLSWEILKKFEELCLQATAVLRPKSHSYSIRLPLHHYCRCVIYLTPSINISYFLCCVIHNLLQRIQFQFFKNFYLLFGLYLLYSLLNRKNHRTWNIFKTLVWLLRCQMHVLVMFKLIPWYTWSGCVDSLLHWMVPTSDESIFTQVVNLL